MVAAEAEETFGYPARDVGIWLSGTERAVPLRGHRRALGSASEGEVNCRTPWCGRGAAKIVSGGARRCVLGPALARAVLLGGLADEHQRRPAQLGHDRRNGDTAQLHSGEDVTVGHEGQHGRRNRTQQDGSASKRYLSKYSSRTTKHGGSDAYPCWVVDVHGRTPSCVSMRAVTPSMTIPVARYRGLSTSLPLLASLVHR